MYRLDPAPPKLPPQEYIDRIAKYDPTVGTPFTVFQKRYISDSIEEYIRPAQSGMVTMTPDTYPVMKRIMAIYHQSGDNGSDEAIQRIANEIGMEYKTVKQYLTIGVSNEARENAENCRMFSTAPPTARSTVLAAKILRKAIDKQLNYLTSNLPPLTGDWKSRPCI